MRNDDHDRLARLAAAQHGVFHLAQAEALGLARRNLRYAERTGGLDAVHAKVWRMPGSPPSDLQTIWAAVLQVGGGSLDVDPIDAATAVASHESAFVVRGILHVPFALAVTTGAGGNQHHPGIRVHRFCDLRPDMVELVDGLPTTTIPRTVVDVASVFRRQRLDDLLDRLTITDRSTTLGAVHRALRRSNRRGRRNIGILQELLDERDRAVPRSVAERDAEELLARSGLPAPVREYPHPGWTVGNAFVDMAWPEAMLIVEIDSRSWHARERAMAKDRARDRSAGAAGWYTARVVHREVVDEPDAVIADIVAIYEQRVAQLRI